MKKMALGRGLDALLPEMNEEHSGVTMIPMDEIMRNPSQPRKNFDEDKLKLLSESIQANGVLQPLLVEEKDGRYVIVAGERRYRAARMARLEAVPCIVKEFTMQERMEASIVENLQREDLNPIEKAVALDELIKKCGYTQETCAKRIGISRPAVSNLLRLLLLPERVREAVAGGMISEGHAKILAGLKDEKQIDRLAGEIISTQMSVRALEEKLEEKPAVEKPHTVRELPLELKDMQNRFLSVTGVKTQIKGNTKKGTLTFRYESKAELEALYELLERLEN